MNKSDLRSAEKKPEAKGQNFEVRIEDWNGVEKTTWEVLELHQCNCIKNRLNKYLKDKAYTE